MKGTDARIETSATDLELKRFRYAQSVEGRFLSYCRGRVRHLWRRALLLAGGFALLSVVADPAAVFLSALVIALGELVDLGLLQLVVRRGVRGHTLRGAIKLTALTGAFQALTLCFLAAQIYVHGDSDARSLAGAVCLVALLDAGLMFGVHQTAARLRIAIFGAVLALMLVDIWVRAEPGDLRPMFDTAAVILLSYVAWAMVRQIGRNRQRKNADRLATLKSSRDLVHSAEALAVSRKSTEQAVRARHNFLATMSHEIRTPMSGIIGTADLLRESDLDASQRDLVKTITTSGEALLAIIDDILDFTKLEAGRFEVAQEVFATEECLGDVVKLISPLAEAKDLALELSLPQDLPKHMCGDSGRVRQVLLNLLGNAVKFTETGGVSVHVTHESTVDTCDLRIDVADTGVGIPEFQLAGIFDSFSQYDAAVAGRFGGTGLGLSISRLLVRAMGGEITAASRRHEGSVFTVHLTLPIAQGTPTQEVQLAPGARVPAVARLEGACVLVAEDNRTNTLLLDRMLAKSGVELVFAVNGREAVELFVRRQPDLVLMDMHMPILDGLAATREIRRFELQNRRAPAPVIALTANAFPEDREKCLAAGMSDVLTKPYRKAELLAALRARLSPALSAT